MLFVAGHNFQTNRRKPFPASRPVPSNPPVGGRDIVAVNCSESGLKIDGRLKFGLKICLCSC